LARNDGSTSLTVFIEGLSTKSAGKNNARVTRWPLSAHLMKLNKNFIFNNGGKYRSTDIYK